MDCRAERDLQRLSDEDYEVLTLGMSSFIEVPGMAPTPGTRCIQLGWYRTQAAYSMAGGSIPLRDTKFSPKATTRRDPPKCRRP